MWVHIPPHLLTPLPLQGNRKEEPCARLVKCVCCANKYECGLIELKWRVASSKQWAASGARSQRQTAREESPPFPAFLHTCATKCKAEVRAGVCSPPMLTCPSRSSHSLLSLCLPLSFSLHMSLFCCPPNERANICSNSFGKLKVISPQLGPDIAISSLRTKFIAGEFAGQMPNELQLIKQNK